MWVKMIQDSGPKNWSTYTWYQVGTDLGAGASATIFDADILGYFMDGGDNKEKGNLGFHAFAANPDAKAPTPNVWIWSLAMNSAWQAEGRRLVFHAMGVARPSTTCSARARWTSSTRSRLGVEGPGIPTPHRQVLRGYLDQYDASAPGAKIYFTAQPLFFDVTTQWAERCRRWSRRKCRSTKASTSSPLDRQAVQGRGPRLTPASSSRRLPACGKRRGRRRVAPASSRIRTTMSTSGVAPHDRHAAVARAGAPQDAAAALSAEPAGAARLHRHPDPVRDGGLLFAAALPARLPGDAGLHLVRQLLSFPHRLRVLEHGAGLAELHRADGRASSFCSASSSRCFCRSGRGSTTSLRPAAAAADDGAGDRGADVEADDEPELRHPVLFRAAAGRARFQMGVRRRRPRCSPSFWSTSGSTRRSS